MQTATYAFAANDFSFKAVIVEGLSHFEAAVRAQNIANETGKWVNACTVAADGSQWPDNRIGDQGLVMPCKR